MCERARTKRPLQDELATTVGKADRTKQLLYFPDIDGYRFRAGSGGIFLGSKDLFISELSASCYVSCRREIGDDGRGKVRRWWRRTLAAACAVPDPSTFELLCVAYFSIPF